MPQSSTYLRKKFMTELDDGINTCQNIIKKNGGTINDKGIISLPPEFNEETAEAAQFLIEEWDFWIIG